MDIDFTFWVVIQYCVIYFAAKIVSSLAIESSFGWLLCPTDIVPFLFFLVLPYFLTLQEAVGSPLIFPAPALESTSSLGWFRYGGRN